MRAAVLALLLAALPVPARAADDERFLYSPMGPGEGKYTLGLGGRTFQFIPQFDISLVYGFTDALDLEVRLSPVGVLNLWDAGVRLRVFGDHAFSGAVRADVTMVLAGFQITSADDSVFNFGALPGIVLAGGDKDFQLAFSLDVPLYPRGAGAVGLGASGAKVALAKVLGNEPPAPGFQVALRPGLAAEVEISDLVNLWVQIYGLVLVTSPGGFAGPFVGIGASF